MADIKPQHWFDDPANKKQIGLAAGQRGLSHKALCEVLGVKDIREYKGTAAEAFGVLAAWDERQAPPDETPAVVTASIDAGPATAVPAPTAVGAGDEALASFSVKAFSPSGFDCMLTIRDSNTQNLMKRAEGVLAWLTVKNFTPPPARSYNGNGNAQAASAGDGDESAPMCPTHHKAMKRSQRGTGFFCPVKVADDDGTGKAVYCKQKA